MCVRTHGGLIEEALVELRVLVPGGAGQTERDLLTDVAVPLPLQLVPADNRQRLLPHGAAMGCQSDGNRL